MMAALIGLVQLRCSVLLARAVYGRGYYLWQLFCRAVLRRRYRPGCAVACQPQLEQNLFMTGLLWFCGTCCGILLQWVV